MIEFNIKDLSEADIRTKYITPAIVKAGWSSFSQMREEYPITKGRIIARGKTCRREMPLKADYVLFYKPNKPIAIVEAKDNNHSIGDGMQQALTYAKMMDIPFVFSQMAMDLYSITNSFPKVTWKQRFRWMSFPRLIHYGKCITNKRTSARHRIRLSTNPIILIIPTNTRAITR